MTFLSCRCGFKAEDPNMFARHGVECDYSPLERPVFIFPTSGSQVIPERHGLGALLTVKREKRD